MSSSIPKNYDHKDIEQKWYDFWLNNRLFESVPDDRPPYTIVMPPPNVTNNLHLGHALNNVYQDILIRFHKMCGYNTLWVPGTDHGGIATQNVVEKMLKADRGLTKEDIGRSKFLDIVNEWKDEKRAIIVNQLKRLGCSCAWSREQFTMNERLSLWVKRAFAHLFHKGLIYKGKYIVNWCPRCETALSNEEVDQEENKEGKLYYIRYKFVNTDEYLIVATTRPETMFGDTSIAYNPEDSRYTKYKGQLLVNPVNGQLIPLIPDSHAKQDFGTGLVKITPAHNKDDYEVAKRHNLEPIVIMDERGVIRNTGSPYDGMDRFAARTAIIQFLTENNSMEKVEAHQNTCNICYRCKTVIEPYLSDQWFLRMKDLNKQGLLAVEHGDISISPKFHETVYNGWLNKGIAENIDWCISRQIWWGHRIPILYCLSCDHVMCDDKNEEISTCTSCSSPNLKQDDNVLDTWFSSGLFAFSVFEEEELDYYFPTSTLVTGSDILFFWVAKMIMMSSEIMNSKPFTEVFLHGIVRDEKGEKMSKSKGNGIDPMVIIDTYSADALRFTLAITAPFGQDVNIGMKSFEVGKTFCTKLWNAVRYLLMELPQEPCSIDITTFGDQCTHIDKWILNRLNRVITKTTDMINSYDFMAATQCLYQFVWNDFCNAYLEYAKCSIDTVTTRNTLVLVIETVIRLLHPFIPFLTEEIWSMLKPMVPSLAAYQSILELTWPTVMNMGPYNESHDEIFTLYQDMIKKVRNVKGDFQVKADDIVIIVDSESDAVINFIRDNVKPVIKMCRVQQPVFGKENRDQKAKYLEYDVKSHNHSLTLSFEFDKDKFNMDTKIGSINNRIAKMEGRIVEVEKLLQNQDKLGEKRRDKLERELAVFRGAIVDLGNELATYM